MPDIPTLIAKIAEMGRRISFPGATLTLLLGVILLLGTLLMFTQGKRRGTIALVGMIVCGIGFIGFATIYVVGA